MRSDRALRGAVLAAALLMAAGPAQAQAWRNLTSARQLQGERALDVKVEYGAGDLTVRPGNAELLYRMQLRYDERQTRPVAEYDRAGGALRLGVAAARRNQRMERGGTAVVELAPAVPLDLDLAFGAGRASVELGGLALRTLELSTGASETTVRVGSPNRVQASRVVLEAGAARLHASGLGNLRAEHISLSAGAGDATLEFDGDWARGAAVEVEMGVGTLTLRFPRGLGVRIEKDSFLTSFSPAGMVRRDGAWYSRDYDRAETRVTVRLEAALGDINVQWLDGGR